MTIMLPSGTVNTWQHAIDCDDFALWFDLSATLFKSAYNSDSRTERDDLLTLSLIACEHSNTIWKREAA